MWGRIRPEEWFALPEGREYMVQTFIEDMGWKAIQEVLFLPEAKIKAREYAGYGSFARVVRISRYSWSDEALVQSIHSLYYPTKKER